MGSTKALFLALPLISLLLSGCGTMKTAQGQQGRPEKPPATSTSNARSTSCAATRSSTLPVRSPDLSMIAMANTTTGWGVTQSAPSPLVLRTSDGGITWIDVTPLEVKGLLVFLSSSAQAASIAVIHPGESATIYRTSDGGEVWSCGDSFPVKFGDGGASLSFYGQTGWLEIGSAGLNGPLPAELFATTNGGLDWEPLSTSTGAADGSFPGNGPVELASPSVGYTAPIRSSGLYKTTNGGRSWTQIELGVRQAQVMGLPIFSGRDGLMWVSATSSTLMFLRSSNSGITWKSIPTKIPLGATVDAISGRVVVAVTQQGDIYSSSTGGSAWDLRSANATLSDLLRTHFVASVDFLSLKEGWLTLAPRASATNVILLHTEDGGSDWEVVDR